MNEIERINAVLAGTCRCLGCAVPVEMPGYCPSCQRLERWLDQRERENHEAATRTHAFYSSLPRRVDGLGVAHRRSPLSTQTLWRSAAIALFLAVDVGVLWLMFAGVRAIWRAWRGW